jgi:hypothetical protein
MHEESQRWERPNVEEICGKDGIAYGFGRTGSILKDVGKPGLYRKLQK